MKPLAEAPQQKKPCLKSDCNPFPRVSSPPTMPKAKTSSTDRVICSCGCGDTVTRRTQSRHLQGHGPLMAVAGVLKTRAYFHKRGSDNSESPRPRKRQRVITPTSELWPPSAPTQQELSPLCQQDSEPTTPPPNPTPASSIDPASNVAHIALSLPWMGPADFRYNDDEDFEGSNEVNHDGTQLKSTDSTPEPEGPDMGSDESGNISESERSGTGVSDMFDMNVGLNTAECSEWTAALARQHSQAICSPVHTQRSTTLEQAILICCASSR